MIADGPLWFLAKDGNPDAYMMARRHYSASKNKNQKIRQFVGPGEKVVLITEKNDAIWAWRKFIDDSGQRGICCSIFRNEGRTQSSLLIQQACRIADAIWPGERCYTYVDAAKIASANPGWCFQCAGWVFVRDSHGKPLYTKSGQLILEYKHASA